MNQLFQIGDLVTVNNGEDLGFVVAVIPIWDVDTDEFSHWSYSVALGAGRRRVRSANPVLFTR